jgi:hypothetical protein
MAVILNKDDYPEIIRAFLENPYNREAFDAFFKLCFNHTRAYLYSLKHIGYDLMLEDRDDRKAITDRAIDILGPFLSSKVGQPYYRIFDYFERKNLTNLKTVSDQQLYHHFNILLRGFIKHELGAIRKLENPGIYNLKKAFRNILREEEFCETAHAKKGHEQIYLCKYAEDLRSDKPAIPYDELYKLAEKAYYDTNTRVQWCHKIFELLNEVRVYQNQVVKYELIRVVVSINAKYVDLCGLRLSAMPSARDTAIRGAIDKARKKTILWLKKEVIPDFVKKGRIDQDEAERFAKAAELFLIDLGNDDWTDSIPDYFRALMPEEKHIPYLNDYKYVFETVIEKAREYFKKNLGDDPTIAGFGDY